VSVTPIHVVAAVLEDTAGRILLAQRPEASHQGGLWEFPGGKVEPGESVAEALRRELREEIAVEVLAHRPLIRVRHAYADRTVVLDVHRVTSHAGDATGLEGQPLVWVAADDLHHYPMPAADRPIVTAICLPDTYVITPPDPRDLDHFAASLKAVLRRGTRLVQLRLPTLDRAAVEPRVRACVLTNRNSETPRRTSSSVARFSKPNRPSLTYIVCGTRNGRSASSPGTGPMLQVSVPTAAIRRS